MYFGPQLVILVVATTLTRITSVHSRPTNDDEFDAPSHMAKSFAEDESPDVSEQLRHHDRELEREAKKRNEPRVEKYDAPQQDEKTSAETDATTASVTISLVHMPTEPTEEPKKRLAIHIDDVDIADREDHVTQYLADLLVNTDSEITCLQASEIEDEREAVEVKEDAFFAFLTGQERPLDVEGAWSLPAEEKDEDLRNNAISDVEYKD